MRPVRPALTAAAILLAWLLAMAGCEFAQILPLAASPRPTRAEGGPDARTRIEAVGRGLVVDGSPFLIRGVGYAPTPIGSDPETLPPHGDFFTQEFKDIYQRDLRLLRAMGANAVRLWGWKYDADHTDFLNAAYNGGQQPIYVLAPYWLDASRDISNPEERAAIVDEFRRMVVLHKDHPAILMWVIGNELNAPWMFGDQENLYHLIEEMAAAAHAVEGDHPHPVTTPLADFHLIETIRQAEPLVPHLDLWSVQVYRGASFGSLFADYAQVSKKPLVITEYGTDAFDDRHGGEYESRGASEQARFATSLWREIASHSDVCAGGAVMTYSDEWWKGKKGQADEKHTACPEGDPAYQSACGYANGAFPDGYANEEWWGIVRVIKRGDGIDQVQPRAAYYALRDLWNTTVYLPIVNRK